MQTALVNSGAMRENHAFRLVSPEPPPPSSHQRATHMRPTSPHASHKPACVPQAHMRPWSLLRAAGRGKQGHSVQTGGELMVPG